MTDLVERLRAWAGARTVHAAMASEAADEIERLLAKVNELDGMWRSADKGGQAEIERLRAERALSMSTASGLALDAAAKDDEIEREYAAQVIPAVRNFKPDLLLISAGFDAHEMDPLGQLRMTTEGFGRLTKTLIDLANEVCEGRAVLVTEGGYDLKALSDSLKAVIGACR